MKKLHPHDRVRALEAPNVSGVALGDTGTIQDLPQRKNCLPVVFDGHTETVWVHKTRLQKLREAEKVSQMPLPSVDAFGNLSETFLRLGEDGVVRVKDGRTLEQYINDPRLIERRKGRGAAGEMVLAGKALFELGTIPRSC